MGVVFQLYDSPEPVELADAVPLVPPLQLTGVPVAVTTGSGFTVMVTVELALGQGDPGTESVVNVNTTVPLVIVGV